MAINLRLTDSSEQALDSLARSTGLSKNDVINQAIVEKASRESQSEEVRALARQAIKDYENLLDRLAQ